MKCTRIDPNEKNTANLVGRFVILLSSHSSYECPSLRMISHFSGAMIFLENSSHNQFNEQVTETLSLEEARHRVRSFELENGDEVFYRTKKATVIGFNGASNETTLSFANLPEETFTVSLAHLDLTPTLLLLCDLDWED